MKFTFVKINMKQVSYIANSHYLIGFNKSTENNDFGTNRFFSFKCIRKKRNIDGLGLINLFFLIPRTLLMSFWCDACSVSAIGESNGKSQLAKYFQNSYALESYGGLKVEGSKIS